MKNMFFMAVAVIALGVALQPQNVHAWDRIATPSCSLSTKSGDIRVNFPDKHLFSTNGGHNSKGESLHNPSESASANIPAGTYEVMLQTFDGYTTRSESRQPRESLYVSFNGGGRTAATPDLADGGNTAYYKGTVNDRLQIGRTTRVTVQHAAYVDNSSPNSLVPVCMVLRPVPVCGNGKVESGEQCDDGNTKNGDGCSAQCKDEKPAIKIEKRDAADKDDLQHVDQNSTATFEIIVTNTGAVNLKNVKVTDPKEPNCNKTIGSLAVGKRYTYTCKSTNVTKNFTNTANVVGTPVNGGANVTDTDPTKVVVKAPAGPVCGNGKVESGEQCDDGNTKNGDGCSATCQKEQTPKPTGPICGNGIVEGGEECDGGSDCDKYCRDKEDDDDCDAKIGDVVWYDKNGNGIQDAGEGGISGVKLKLYNGNDVETDRTNSEGRYKFKNLCEGEYKIIVAQETLPAGCVPTYDRDGKLDHKYKKELDKDQSYKKADFGYRCSTPRATTYTAPTTSPQTGPGAVAGGLAAALSAGATYLYRRRAEALEDADLTQSFIEKK